MEGYFLPCRALRGGSGWLRGVLGEEEVEAGSDNHSLDMYSLRRRE